MGVGYTVKVPPHTPEQERLMFQVYRPLLCTSVPRQASICLTQDAIQVAYIGPF